MGRISLLAAVNNGVNLVQGISYRLKVFGRVEGYFDEVIKKALSGISIAALSLLERKSHPP